MNPHPLTLQSSHQPILQRVPTNSPSHTLAPAESAILLLLWPLAHLPGMGMDTNQQFRSLDYVAVLKPEAIQRALNP